MHRLPERLASAITVLILTSACSGAGTSAPESIAFTTTVATPIPTMPGPPQNRLEAYPISDHIVRDGNGGYLCVLRRNGDLASLRGQYISRADSNQ